MSEQAYLDFDLLVARSDDGAMSARVVDSPAGQAVHEFELPFSDLEVENFLLRVGQTRGRTRRLESSEMESARQFGSRLYDALFDGEVRTAFRRSLDDADRQQKGLRVRLRMNDVPEVADLPWEFLYSSGLNRFLALSTETPLVRYIDLPSSTRPLTVTPPLRILVMISSPTDYPELDVMSEWTRLQSALQELADRGLVELDKLEEASLSRLQQRLRQGEYHIFHFIGHGAFDERERDGVLMLEDDQQRGRRVSGHYLGTLLHDHRSMRLAVLNSCEGARATRDDPFAGTAQSLVQQGIPAVIA
ncbi:MAG: CHAT domain-containing protein, partial [Acidimicrobiia bacterium]|nr:CHAT domain-containing protein [Acidimicrobiia bacterium]